MKKWIRRRAGDGTVYYQHSRCTETFGNDKKRYRCTLPDKHEDEKIDFHTATDGRNSFVWRKFQR